MSTQKKTGLVVLGLIVLTMLGLGWHEFNSLNKVDECGFCRRPINERLRTVVEIDGTRKQVCCPRCAVTESRQEHKPIRLITVRDYSTGKDLDPKPAWYVSESHALACTHDSMRMDEMKQSETLAFDRCSPGTFAFAKKEDAELFVNQHSGRVQTMEQLLEGIRDDQQNH
jgi:hypothetical protein